MWSRTGISCGASPHWPGVMTNARGRRPPFARQMNLAGQPAPGAAQSLVAPMLNGLAMPPAGNAWCPGAGSCGVLVGPAGGRVHADHAPVDPAFRIGIGLDRPQTLPLCAIG